MSHSYSQNEDCGETRSDAKNNNNNPHKAALDGQPELSIAEVRKALSFLRKGWEEVQIDPKSKPLYLSNVLSLSTAQSIRMEEFALRFVLTHHQKRQSGNMSRDD
jgi:hypothetical protein